MSALNRSRVRELIHKGNVRHVVVEKGGHRTVDLPLNVVIVAAILAIWAVGILLILALVGGYSIHIEDGQSDDSPDDPTVVDVMPPTGQPES